MTYATLNSTGSGTVGYRLMIEGWPEEWVTNARITAADNLDGRTVSVGLSCQGLQLNERIIMREAVTEPSGLTFKIVPPRGSMDDDPALASFSVYPDPVAMLTLGVDDTDTGMQITGTTLTDEEVYHIGTEAFRVKTVATPYTVERTVWNTLPQKHGTSVLDETRAVYVYARPPTMEGRRCYLYMYEHGDDPDGDGTCIWRGIVSRPPKLADDCVAWTIEALPITFALRQTLGGRFQDTHPVGIYHHALCCFGFRIDYDGDYGDIRQYPESGLGHTPIDSEATLVDAIDSLFASELTSTGADAEIDFVGLTKNANGGWSLVCVTGTVASKFQIIGASPIIGHFHTSNQTKWKDEDGNERDGWNTLLASNTTYYAELINIPEWDYLPGNPWSYGSDGAAPIGDASGVMYAGARTGFHNLPQAFCRSTDLQVHQDWPPNRVYVNNDLQDAIDNGIESVRIADTFDVGGTYALTGAGQTSKTVNGATNNFQYITIDVPTVLPSHTGVPTFEEYSLSRAFHGIITASSQISPIRSYSIGSVADFAASIVAESVNANDGDTPFITDADLATWALQGDSIGAELLFRSYRFARELTAEAVLAEDLKYAAHCMRLESDGRIGIIPLPLVTDTHPVDTTHTIDSSSLITPAAGFGMWPGAEPQRDGILTTVSIQDGYDPVEGNWTNDPQIFQDANAIATHKTRGKSKMEIKPYSRSTGLFSVLNRGVQQIAERYLGFFARDYTVVTVKVPYTKFAILCGDVVSLTSRYTPAGDGTRGVVSRRGVVIERRWNLDPAVQDHGTLVIWIQAHAVYGYAAAGQITSQTNTSGNEWDIVIDPANALNINLSTDGDGKILKHFVDGQNVRIVQQDDGTPTDLTATIDDIDEDAGTCTVTTASSWTPSTSTWNLEFPLFANADTQQKKYAYVADDDTFLLPDGVFARRFA